MLFRCKNCGGLVAFQNGDAAGTCKGCGLKQEINEHFIYEQANLFALENTEESLEQAMNLYRAVPGWKDANQKYKDCRTQLGRMRWQKESALLKAEETRFEAKISKLKKAGIAVLAVLLICIAIVTIVTLYQFKKYNTAAEFFVSAQYARSAEAFRELNGYKDAKAKVYISALELYKAKRYKEAAPYFAWLRGYTDNGYYLKKCWERIAVLDSSASSASHKVELKEDGTVIASGENDKGQCNVSDWTDIVSVAVGNRYTVGLKKDGTVVAVGENEDGQCNVESWTNIISISAKNGHTVGLKADCTVVATGKNTDGQCNVSDWADIVFISAGENYTLGQKGDGSTVIAGKDDSDLKSTLD